MRGVLNYLYTKIRTSTYLKPFEDGQNAVQYSEIAVMEAFELNEINEI